MTSNSPHASYPLRYIMSVHDAIKKSDMTLLKSVYEITKSHGLRNPWQLIYKRFARDYMDY